MQTNNKKNIIIFCQSLGDINYSSQIIDNNENYTIVITLQSVYNFVLKYKIFNDSNIIFITYPKQKINYFNFVIKYQRTIINLKKKYYDKVYIFSLGFDWISLSLLKSLRKNIESIYHIDYYNNLPPANKKLSTHRVIRSIYYFLHTGIWFSYYSDIKNRTIVTFNKNWAKIINTNIVLPNYNKDLFINKINSNNTSLVIIDSPADVFKCQKSENLLKAVIDEFIKRNHDVYIKKHPNFEYSFSFLNIIQKIDDVPSEFIDMSDINYIISFGSSALIKNNCKYKISLLEIIRNNENNEEIERFKRNLDNLDKNKELIYPETLNELLHTLFNRC